MARVSVTVNVRDMTRGELTRIRRNFNNLGQDMERIMSNRTRQNFDRLNQALRTTRGDLNRLRGAIPDAEFFRLDNAVRQAQQTMSRGFRRVGTNELARIEQHVVAVGDAFRNLDQTSQIRVRVDTSALRRADAQLEAWRLRQARNAVRVPVRADVDRGLMSRVGRAILSPLRGLGGLISGILSDGIGQGIIGSFASPVFGVALVTAIAGALSMLGAAIAGALVFALGGAFVGLGVMMALQAKGVSERWTSTLKGLKPLFEDAAKPLIPVIDNARVKFDQMAREFAPHFKEAMEQAGPTLNGFLDRTKEGFRRMGEHAWDDLQEAFRVFVTAFGPVWEKFLSKFGEALGALARTVRDHSTEMAMALGLVLSAINGIINVINFFANAWVMGIQFCIAAAATFIDMLGMVSNGFLGMVDTMLGGLETVAELLGFGDEVAAARESFGQLRDDAIGKFTDMAAEVRKMGTDMDYANRERVLTVNIDSWNSQLTAALAKLKTVPPDQQTALKGEISDLRAKIASAQGALASMKTDYYVRIHAYKTGDWAIGGGGPGQASGGITGSHLNRAATGGARSNMTLVGEQGPEIVNLAPGSHVRSNADSRRLAAQSGTTGGPNLILKSSGRRVDDLLIEILREAIHQRGGDPVTVLGGR